jgi:hypothetical protein
MTGPVTGDELRANAAGTALFAGATGASVVAEIAGWEFAIDGMSIVVTEAE